MIPEGGFGNANALQGGNENTIKSLKTTNLRAYRNKLEEKENLSQQVAHSKNEIEQYNNVKSILMNFSFEN
jgi:hypothetical protein